MLHTRFTLNLLILSLITSSYLILTDSISRSDGEEEFNEDILLKPLPDRKVLAHFHFETKAPPTSIYGRHHSIFPKAIYQLVQKYRIREMELSFTRGRWNYERWGGSDPISSSNAKPPGIELWAIFDVPQDLVDSSWKNLTHTLSGLFCASINFLESSTAYSAPIWGFRPFLGSLRYGTLPREAVCTENLTPWLKLLPCRDKSGLSTLLDRPSVYKGYYHSQRLHLTSDEFNSIGNRSGILLEQTLTVVLQPSLTYSTDQSLQPSWSLSSIFGSKINDRCILAKFSNIYIQLDRGLVSKLRNFHIEDKISKDEDFVSDESWINKAFKLSIVPDGYINEVTDMESKSFSILLVFLIENYNSSRPFDLGFAWNRPVLWPCSQVPLQASRFLMGSGNERGSIAIHLRSNKLGDDYPSVDISDRKCSFRVNIFQLVPWYVKVYYHTLQVYVNEHLQSGIDVIEKIHVSPSEDKISPGLMEIALKFSCAIKSAAITIDFAKGFLHIDEYPPDANQGFDIPAAIISFPDFYTGMDFVRDKPWIQSTMISRLLERRPVLSYTEVLLVPLTTPDFSMPYNVITITCTVFALYFGSLLNVLRRRVGEEERLLKSNAKKMGLLAMLLCKISAKLRLQPSGSSSLMKSKLMFKIVLVAGMAVALHYYLE